METLLLILSVLYVYRWYIISAAVLVHTCWFVAKKLAQLRWQHFRFLVKPFEKVFCAFKFAVFVIGCITVFYAYCYYRGDITFYLMDKDTKEYVYMSNGK